MALGGLSVTIPGISMTRELFVGSLDLRMLLELEGVLTLVQEVVPYGWTTCTVGVMKDPLQIVRTMDGATTTVVTLKMHQSSVLVSFTINTCYS